MLSPVKKILCPTLKLEEHLGSSAKGNKSVNFCTELVCYPREASFYLVSSKLLYKKGRQIQKEEEEANEVI